MWEFFIGWLGIVAIFATIGRTTYCCIRLYYTNEKEKRMERFDRSLQISQATGVMPLLGEENDELSERLSKLSEQNNSTAKFGDAVLSECERRGIVTRDRARYIRA